MRLGIDPAMARFPFPNRGSLFWQYFFVLFAAVAVPLLAAGSSQAWFGYKDQRAHLNDLLGAEARTAAARIAARVSGDRPRIGCAQKLILGC